jgi:hypothetical protein
MSMTLISFSVIIDANDQFDTVALDTADKFVPTFLLPFCLHDAFLFVFQS